MVRILPALVGAVALGAATVIRNRKRSAKRAKSPRTKPASAKRTRRVAARKTIKHSRSKRAAKR